MIFSDDNKQRLLLFSVHSAICAIFDLSELAWLSFLTAKVAVQQGLTKYVCLFVCLFVCAICEIHLLKVHQANQSTV